ncbi:glycosyltransferase [Mesorhizobium sp. BAC0120]|uniref:glycosyltransferase n=1 Tax=Mesorhizobium sp. BAC0120 TaxID=3090670 RepID=UPI00298C32DF|nr:glycosyltransferase [Mesorhizobium sp. BAC0120]MDW6023090.1 glycosyltransferase [Mesorhizobium sp. BAC0120]
MAALIDTAIVSGPGRQLAALADRLSTYGVRLRVYMFQRVGHPLSPFSAYLERAGIEHVVISETGPFDMSLLSKVGRSLREWKPDIVQTHNYRTTVLAYLLSWGYPDWRWLAFCHGWTNEDWKVRVYNRIDRALLPRADRLVVMSERHRRQFLRDHPEVTVIYNAVLQLPEESDSIDLEHLHLPERPAIGVVGRLSHEKGVDVLLAAISRLPAGSVSLLVAGEGPERLALGRQAVELHIESQVHFLGSVRDVRKLYRQLDAIVLPSRTEGLPNVLLEAVSEDVPVVATRVGAVPEVLTDEASGWIVEPDDAAGLATAISLALANGRSASARQARRETAKRFSLEERVRRHLRLYAELCPDRISGTAT